MIQIMEEELQKLEAGTEYGPAIDPEQTIRFLKQVVKDIRNRIESERGEKGYLEKRIAVYKNAVPNAINSGVVTELRLVLTDIARIFEEEKNFADEQRRYTCDAETIWVELKRRICGEGE